MQIYRRIFYLKENVLMEAQKDEILNLFSSIYKKIENIPRIQKYIPMLKATEKQFREPVNVMVMGEFSAGKSSFINALLGRNVTAVEAQPKTAVITKLCYGPADQVFVHLKDGRVEECNVDEFEKLTSIIVSQKADSEQKKHDIGSLFKFGKKILGSLKGEKEFDIRKTNIEYVERRIPSELLKYINLIDSPGFNDIDERHSDITENFVQHSDAVLWIFSESHVGSESEIEALKKIKTSTKPVAIINKMDLWDEEEEEISEEEYLDKQKEKFGDAVCDVIGVSARFAIEGNQENNQLKKQIGNFDSVTSFIYDKILTHQQEYKVNALVLGLLPFFNKCLLALNEPDDDEKAYTAINVRKRFFYFIQTMEPMIQIIFSNVNQDLVKNGDFLLFMGYLVDDGVLSDSKYLQPREYFKQAYDAGMGLAIFFLLDEKYGENLETLWNLIHQGIQRNDVYAKMAFLIFSQAHKEYANRYSIDKIISDIELLFQHSNGEIDEFGLISYALARIYVDKNNLIKAIKYLEIAYAKGMSVAASILGHCYLYGEGVEKDIEKGIALLNEAIEENDTDSLLFLGDFYLIPDTVYYNPQEGARLVLAGALNNQADAENLVGKCYFDGTGVNEDKITARKWFTKSAEQDNSAALYNLAVCFELGEGGEQNTSKALQLYLRSGNLGYANAQVKLSQLYFEGIEFEKNDVEAFDWAMKAAKQQNSAGEFLLGWYFVDGVGTEVNKKKALEWIQQAKNHGNADALGVLGAFYEEGEIVPQDDAQAKKLYEEGVRKKSSLCAIYLGNLSTSTYKNLTKKTVSQAVQFYINACQWSTQLYFAEIAALSLAVLTIRYSKYSEAEKILLDIHIPELMIRRNNMLGQMYLRDDIRNISKAKYYLRQAAEKGDKEASDLLDKIASGAFARQAASTGCLLPIIGCILIITIIGLIF